MLKKLLLEEQRKLLKFRSWLITSVNEAEMRERFFEILSTFIAMPLLAWTAYNEGWLWAAVPFVLLFFWGVYEEGKIFIRWWKR